MSNLTREQRTALAVLLSKGAADQEVAWLHVALQVSSRVLCELVDLRLATMTHTAFPNNRFRLTAAGVAEARKVRS